MITAEDIHSAVESAYSLADGGDYDGAIAAAVKAQAMMGAMANINRGLAGGGSQSLTWPGAGSLQTAIDNWRRLAKKAAYATYGVFQQCNEVLARPPDLDAYQ